MSLNPLMDMWRYKIVGNEMPRVSSETDVWQPQLNMETDVIWEEDMALEALEALRQSNPNAQFTLMRTRDRWEEA